MGDELLRTKLTALRSGEILPEELYELVHDFGHAMFVDAEPDVVALLDHLNERIRCIAVRVLTFHWNISRHWDRLIRLLRDDPDDEVKSFTAAGLGFARGGGAAAGDGRAAGLGCRPGRDHQRRAGRRGAASPPDTHDSPAGGRAGTRCSCARPSSIRSTSRCPSSRRDGP